MSQTDWSDLGMTDLLPTGMVTLLLADVEGSTRLWESQSKDMAAAVARLVDVLAEVVAQHHGIRPVEQDEGDSLVLAFARASDAVACALQLQLAPLAPLRLRVDVHTGEVQLRDEGNYMGSTINRTARLRDLAHGGWPSRWPGNFVFPTACDTSTLRRLPTPTWCALRWRARWACPISRVARLTTRYQVLDQLTLLVDKSLLIAENKSGRTRYRLLETFASMHWKSSANPARLMRSVIVTGITTQRSRPCWMRQPTPAIPVA